MSSSLESSLKPNAPANSRFLTNTEHQTLEDYLAAVSDHDIVNEIFRSKPEELIMLDEAYSLKGTLIPGHKAVFRRFV
ncbi:MAG: hypothetical protein KME47_09870 [Nodosilinea sp. WJT8-NPBG4]|jgi:hypothetical protein|nr:hypothetical protein [Nodosilinea sp. WJT8-NPBG4]